MNILLLAPHPFFQNRGTPIAEKMVIGVLTANGHRVRLLTYHEGESIDMEGLEIHRISTLTGVRNIQPGPSLKKIVCDIFMFLKLLQMVSRKKPDLIHAVEESAFMALLIKLVFRIPYIFDMDSSLAQQLVEKYPSLKVLNPVFESVEGLAARGSAGIIAVCREIESIAIKYAPENPVLRLEDISLLDGNCDGSEILFDTETHAKVVMYIGNLETYQGIDLLLDTFGRVVKKGFNCELVIIGGSDEDIEKYRRLSDEMGLSGRVRLIGKRPVTHLGHYMKQADILVSPRIKGRNTPMKIYSYLDSGRPVLATRLKTHTQVLDNSIAMLSKPDPESMSKALVTLLTEQETGKKLAESAKERVREEFSFEAFNKKLYGFYLKIEEEVKGPKSQQQQMSTGTNLKHRD